MAGLDPATSLPRHEVAGSSPAMTVYREGRDSSQEELALTIIHRKIRLHRRPPVESFVPRGQTGMAVAP